MSWFERVLDDVYSGKVTDVLEAFKAGFIHSETIARCYARGFSPAPPLTVSEWADAYRVLTTVDTDESGPWRTERTPYLREIMDRLGVDDPAKVVVLMKGAQIGATQSANNFLGYAIHYAPGPILMVQPTVDMAKRNVRQRIEPMILACSVLSEKVGRVAGLNTQASTILTKMFPGGLLAFTGSNSAANLRSFSARYLVLDEVDGYPVNVDGEGDPVEIAMARTRNFHRSKTYIISTPTVMGTSRVESAFLEGDQRYFYVPCPLCSHMQVLKLGGRETSYGLRWETTKTGRPKGEVRYLCEKCTRFFQEHHKTAMLNAGEWRPHNNDPKDGVRSYHLGSIYSPYGWYGWDKLRDDFLAARKFPLKLRTFVNTVLGETFRDEISRADGLSAYARREPYPFEDGVRVVPREVVLLTGGVDVQQDRLEFSIYGWGAHPDFGSGALEECWAIERQIVPGDPAKAETWAELWRRMTLPRAFQDGRKDYVRAWCVDAGYMTAKVYDFCRPRYRVDTPDNRKIWVFATLGRAGPGILWPRTPSRNKIAKILLWILKVDAGKESLLARLNMRERGPGYIHFPNTDEFDESFFKQLTAEQRTMEFDPRGAPVYTWSRIQPGARNEQLDLWVMAFAALQGLFAHGLDFARLSREHIAALSKLAAKIAKETGKPPPDPRIQPRTDLRNKDGPMAPQEAIEGLEGHLGAGAERSTLDPAGGDGLGSNPGDPLGGMPRVGRRGRRRSYAF